MRYREIKPPSHLKDIVRFFWSVERRSYSSKELSFRIVADGSPGIICLRSGSQFSSGGNKVERLPKLFLYGQTTNPGLLHTAGKVSIVGVNFYPHALKAIFGFDAKEALDQIIDLDLIRTNLSEQICEAHKTEKRIDLLSRFITEKFTEHHFPDDLVAGSLRKINRNMGNIPIYHLYENLQISERQFQRRFKQHIGINPKLFARIIRFQSAFNQVRSHHYQHLSDVAFDNGYADQSHFIRDFKEFAGLKPSTYRLRQFPFLCQHREFDSLYN